jgi:TRAP-type C4-dicarboxylate transport system substrate-binding protein
LIRLRGLFRQRGHLPQAAVTARQVVLPYPFLINPRSTARQRCDDIACAGKDRPDLNALNPTDVRDGRRDLENVMRYGLLAASVFACGIAMGSLAPAKAEEQRLIFTSLSPPNSPNSQFFNDWAKRVNDKSNGTIKVEVRDGLALANYENIYTRVLDDVVQIGWATFPTLAGKFPLAEVPGLPFVSDNSEHASVALWRLYKSGMLNSEINEVVPIWIAVYPPPRLHLAKPPHSLDDLAGIKIGTSARYEAALIEKLGGTPISARPTQLYELLQRNTIDGTAMSWAAFAPFNLKEVTSYHVELPFGGGSGMFFMSKKKFDALPAEARKALEEEGGEAMSRKFGIYFDEQAAQQRAIVVAMPDKHKIVELTDAQMKSWHEKSQPIIEDWVKTRPAGDGQKVLDAYRQLIAKLKAGQ